MTYNSVDELFTGICNAVRYKDGSAEQIPHQDIPQRIMEIEGSEPAIFEIDIPIDEVSFEYIPEESISAVEDLSDISVVDIKILDNTSTLGLSSSSTAEEIYNATNGIVETICEALGMTEISHVIGSAGWYSNLALSGEKTPIMRVGFANHSSYKHYMFFCSTLYAYNTSESVTGTTYMTAVENSALYRSLNVLSSPLCIRYVKNQNGNIAFDFHIQSDTSNTLSFLLADITYLHEDGISSDTSKCLMHTNLSNFVLSVKKEWGYYGGTISGYNYVPNLTDIYKKEGYETMTCPLSVGHNMMLDESIRLYTNNNIANNGELLEINGDIYMILYCINSSSPTLLMKIKTGGGISEEDI